MPVYMRKKVPNKGILSIRDPKASGNTGMTKMQQAGGVRTTTYDTGSGAPVSVVSKGIGHQDLATVKGIPGMTMEQFNQAGDRLQAGEFIVHDPNNNMARQPKETFLTDRREKLLSGGPGMSQKLSTAQSKSLAAGNRASRLGFMRPDIRRIILAEEDRAAGRAHQEALATAQFVTPEELRQKGLNTRNERTETGLTDRNTYTQDQTTERTGMTEEGLSTRQGVTEEGLNTRQAAAETGLTNRQATAEEGLNTRQAAAEKGAAERQEALNKANERLERIKQSEGHFGATEETEREKIKANAEVEKAQVQAAASFGKADQHAKYKTSLKKAKTEADSVVAAAMLNLTFNPALRGIESVEQWDAIEARIRTAVDNGEDPQPVIDGLKEQARAAGVI